MSEKVQAAVQPKTKKKISIFNILVYVFFGILAVVTIYPFYNVIILSFANAVATATHVPYFLMHTFDMTSYKVILEDPYFSKSVLNSVFVTVVGTCLSMIVSVSGAYVLSKKRLAGRKFLMTYVVFTMFFGGGTIPTYITVKSLGLLNNIWSMICPSLVSAYYMVIMKNYFLGLPDSIEEAAHIDGANDFVILIRIILPISLPFMATFLLFYAVDYWNGWWNAYLYITKKALWPLQIYLRNILSSLNKELIAQAQKMANQEVVFATSIQMATICISVLPIACVYPFVQKHFVKGVLVGSIKE